jgi:hypothetical protein
MEREREREREREKDVCSSVAVSFIIFSGLSVAGIKL